MSLVIDGLFTTDDCCIDSNPEVILGKFWAPVCGLKNQYGHTYYGHRLQDRNLVALLNNTPLDWFYTSMTCKPCLKYI